MAFLILFLFFGFYFLAHWMVDCFVVCVLDYKSRKQKYILRISLFVLAASFIVAFFVSHLWSNILTRHFYLVAGLWVGLLINLILFISAFWLLKFIFKLFKKEFNQKIFSRVFFALALVYTIFGVANVYLVRVNEVVVKIENLPEEWEDKKIVQLSDVHLGRILGRRFFDNVLAKVESINPDMILITGDLFDAMDGVMDTFTPSLNNLEAPDGVFYISGNHEVYLGIEKVKSVIAETNINILEDEIVEVDGLQIIGIAYPGFNEEKDVFEIIKNNNYDQERPSILLYHEPSNINSNGDNNHSNAYINPDIDFKAVRELGIDLQLSGHTHKGQIFPFNFITNYIFKGYDYGLKELDGFSIYTTSGTGVWGPTMRTGSRSEIVVIKLEKK